METTKLNVLLAKTDHLATSFKKSVQDYIQFFKDKGGAFKGEKKTYTPKEGTVDEPSKRGNKLVVTTVQEKLDWLKETNTEYINALFSQEATNAAGNAKADLIVDGKNLGNYSSLELLRLKSLIENGDIEQMYANIPVRNDDEEWNATSEDMYNKREIFESSKQIGVAKSIQKESYILSDPNISGLKNADGYKPQVATKDTIIELGDYSFQKFSGEWSHRQRAELLRRRTKLLNAVIEALKTANDVDAVESQMTADKLFNYLHKGI
jgi:hypothetical protein